MSVTCCQRHLVEFNAVCPWNRKCAIDFVHVVLADEMTQILWRNVGDRNQRTEVHQQTAVAVENDHFLIRCAKCQSQAVRRCLPHRTGTEIVQRMRTNLHPVKCGLINSHGDSVRIVPSQNPQRFIAFHHLAVRPAGGK